MGKEKDMSIDDLCITTIRTLSIDAIQKANSGHPGTPMALAPIAYVLWKKILRHNPCNPNWFDRDRFVLSNGHASMLLYALLYLTGYNLTLDDIKNFRQWESKTPGHPEYGITPGVETTTGPLGQGCMNAVGMAIAEAHLAAKFNRGGYKIIDHFTYVLCGDGDLMEGASHEAASLAGHLGLNKLVWIYDDNHITIEGDTNLAYSENVYQRFESYGWHVQDIGEKANDLLAIKEAILNAKKELVKPSLIIVRSHIAYGSPNKQDTSEAHGSPLGEDEVKLTKKSYGWPDNETFIVHENVLRHMRQAIDRGKKLEDDWHHKFEKYENDYPDLAEKFKLFTRGILPQFWNQEILEFDTSKGPIATRVASGKVINILAERIPWLMGGSADLAPSTKTLITNSDYFVKKNYANRNIAWGIREHLMCAACNGMALHGGIRPYASTFLVFTDYARPAIRLAALMRLPIIYIMTHDSIGVGEDGPTHQPVEHLASLRAIPNLCIIRPADANEVVYAWIAALSRDVGPTMLVLSRQVLPIFDRSRYSSAKGVLRGAYVLSKEYNGKPDIILIASGSEVQLIVEAQNILTQEGIKTHVVSMPSWELFREQPESYRNEVLPPEATHRLAVEAAFPMGWKEWVGDDGCILGITKFGASARSRDIYVNYGLSVEDIVKKAEVVLGGVE